MGGGELFHVDGDNFSAYFHLAGAHSLIQCHTGSTCDFTSTLGLGPAASSASFQGESGFIEGQVTVTGFVDLPATFQLQNLTLPVSVTAQFTGERIPFGDPFFSASVSGHGTVTLELPANPRGILDLTYVEFRSATYEFSGIADVTPIFGE